MIQLSYDQVADAAYLRLADAPVHDGLARTVVSDVALENAAINFDLATDGVLLGIEFLGASRVLPAELLNEAAGL